MRQRIIEGALKIFIQQGIKATTMDDIAKQLGISKRTIYEQFQDKRELLLMVVEHAHTQSKKDDRDIFVSSQNSLEGFLKLMKKKRSEFNLKLMKMVVELKRYYPEIIDMKRKHSAEALETLEKIFIKGIEEGVFRADLNPKTSAFLFSTQAHLFFTEQLNKMDLSSLDNTDISPLQVFEDLFLNFLRGISTQKGIKIIEKYMSNTI
ncbi:MAG: TetR/AcrR family transcriptional regulator [Prevotellaceae bacterium]|jgi:AcrR family transcriptional regulator|nr:TetR/AcrR family transcriptional regulator [Prevotellaceae bacterium]